MKTLRVESMAHILKTYRVKKPVLDNETRWSSTYMMLKSLLDARVICDSRGNSEDSLRLLQRDWERINGYVTALEPFFEATITFQSEQLLPGDFFGTWMSCYLKVTKIDSAIAKDLATAMKSRENQLFNNEAFLAAVFLDPRYMPIFFKNDSHGQEKTRIAIENLQKLWKLLNSNDDGESLDESKSNLSEQVIYFKKLCYLLRDIHFI